MVLKSTKNIFPWKQKSCLKGTVARDFLLPIFFHESTGFHDQKYAENCGSEALKLRTSEKIAIAELWSNISLKNNDCGSVYSSCGVAIADSKKSCASPPLVNRYIGALGHHKLKYKS
jgi:hypothetical protein